VNPITFNRVLLVLGAIGVFVAGVLSVEHALSLIPPCGEEGGCLKVAMHPTSYVAPKIAVAYVGLAGYLALWGLALVRAFLKQEGNSKLVMPGFAMAALGALYSLYLQYVSFTEIKAFCPWCFTSAVVLVLTFVVYTAYAQMVSGKSPEVSAEGRRFEAVFAPAALGVIVLGTAGISAISQKANYKPAEIVKVDAKDRVIPTGPLNQVGPNDAPITIVEFADMTCPPCRLSTPKVKEFQQKHPKSIRVIFRHFPLLNTPGHEMAGPAAFTAEFAADKGKFWEYTLSFMGTPDVPKSLEEVKAAAMGVGLDLNELNALLEDPKGAPFDRVQRDFDDAQYLGINTTPTFVVVGKNKPMLKANLQTAIDEIEKGRLKDLLID
jgi:protein-disulfide isomerase